jgi:hypothetical protein
MAGFRSIAAAGVSLQTFLNASFAAEQPADDSTTAILIQTDDLDLDAESEIAPPALSILLYRVDFNKTTRASWSAIGSVDGRSHLPLDLHYLLTAWADNAEQEHRILGRTLQAIESVGALSGPHLHPSGDWLPGETVQLYLEDMATEDLMRTFDSLECDFRLSIPYIARIVVVTGDAVEPVPAVTTLIDGVRPSVPALGGVGG